MDDLISRAAAIDALADYIHNVDKVMGTGHLTADDCKDAAASVFEDLPSAQPETAKRIVGKSRDGMTLWYQCDICNEPVDAQDDFCRGCGRRLTDG